MLAISPTECQAANIDRAAVIRVKAMPARHGACGNDYRAAVGIDVSGVTAVAGGDCAARIQRSGDPQRAIVNINGLGGGLQVGDLQQAVAALVEASDVRQRPAELREEVRIDKAAMGVDRAFGATEVDVVQEGYRTEAAARTKHQLAAQQVRDLVGPVNRACGGSQRDVDVRGQCGARGERAVTGYVNLVDGRAQGRRAAGGPLEGRHSRRAAVQLDQVGGGGGQAAQGALLNNDRRVGRIVVRPCYSHRAVAVDDDVEVATQVACRGDRAATEVPCAGGGNVGDQRPAVEHEIVHCLSGVADCNGVGDRQGAGAADVQRADVQCRATGDGVSDGIGQRDARGGDVGRAGQRAGDGQSTGGTRVVRAGIGQRGAIGNRDVIARFDQRKGAGVFVRIDRQGVDVHRTGEGVETGCTECGGRDRTGGVEVKRTAGLVEHAGAQGQQTVDVDGARAREVQLGCVQRTGAIDGQNARADIDAAVYCGQRAGDVDRAARLENVSGGYDAAGVNVKIARAAHVDLVDYVQRAVDVKDAGARNLDRVCSRCRRHRDVVRVDLHQREVGGNRPGRSDPRRSTGKVAPETRRGVIILVVELLVDVQGRARVGAEVDDAGALVELPTVGDETGLEIERREACEGDVARVEPGHRAGCEHRDVARVPQYLRARGVGVDDVECPGAVEREVSTDVDRVEGVVAQAIVTFGLPLVERTGVHIQRTGDGQRSGAAAGSDVVRAFDVHRAAVDRAGAAERRIALVVIDLATEVHDAVDDQCPVATQVDLIDVQETVFLDVHDAVVDPQSVIKVHFTVRANRDATGRMVDLQELIARRIRAGIPRLAKDPEVVSVVDFRPAKVH